MSGKFFCVCVSFTFEEGSDFRFSVQIASRKLTLITIVGVERNIIHLNLKKVETFLLLLCSCFER